MVTGACRVTSLMPVIVCPPPWYAATDGALLPPDVAGVTVGGLVAADA